MESKRPKKYVLTFHSAESLNETLSRIFTRLIMTVWRFDLKYKYIYIFRNISTSKTVHTRHHLYPSLHFFVKEFGDPALGCPIIPKKNCGLCFPVLIGILRLPIISFFCQTPISAICNFWNYRKLGFFR